VGYVFSQDDRVQRMHAIMRQRPKFRLADLTAIQRDVFVPSSLQLRDLYLDAIRRTKADAGAKRRIRRVLELMAGWDGRYRAEDAAPVAFELFHYRFQQSYYVSRYGEGAA